MPVFYKNLIGVGGNMNEFVVTIGIDDDRNVKWCYPFSWTKSERLKVDTRQFVMGQDKLNLQSLSYYLQEQVDNQFVRLDFRQFDYLTVEPPVWAVVLTYVLVIIVNILVSWWAATNEFSDFTSRFNKFRW